MLNVSLKKQLPCFEIDLCFDIAEYEYIVILGESGAGKSFVSKMIAGLETPDQGSVFLKDKDITYLPPELRKISYLPQGNLLFPHMTIFENLYFPFKVKKIRLHKVKDRIEQIASAFRIEKILGSFPYLVSGGEAQRAALARAILSDPDIIILDEPLNSLDFFNKFELVDFMKKTIKGNKTVIHITHDPFEAKELADRIFYMEEGKLQFVGKWEDFVKDVEGRLPSKIRKLLATSII